MPLSSNHLFNPLVGKLQMSLQCGEHCLYTTNTVKIVLVKCSSYMSSIYELIHIYIGKKCILSVPKFGKKRHTNKNLHLESEFWIEAKTSV